LELTDFETQIRLFQTCHYLNNNLKIYDLCNINEKYLNGLNDKILKQRKFVRVIKLSATFNSKIKNVSFMTNLQKLNINGENCGVNQSEIDGLNLIELYAYDNNKIKNVSFMTNLRKLAIEENCGVNQNGINGLNLIELYANNNNKIKNVSFMTNLKK